MRDTVAQKRRDAGKAEDDLVDAARRRISRQRGGDVGVVEVADHRKIC